MRAARVTSQDGPSAVEVGEVPPPTRSDHQVLIDVAAAGACFPEVLLTRGQYQLKPELPFIPGSEVAGVVAAAPEGGPFAIGDRVAAFCGFGGFAQQVAVGPELVFPLPDAATFEKGAGIPMNYLTVHFALRTRGRLARGESVLVHGASGGIGTAAIQLAKAWGARVIAVASTTERGQIARVAGADEVVLADDFLPAVKELTGGRGVDLVLDPVGGDRFTDSLRALAPLGRLLVVGFAAGSIPQVKVNRLLLNNISVLGVGWGAWWMGAGGAGFLQEQWADLAPLITSGAIDPPIGQVHDLTDAAQAIADLDERRTTGKVILRMR